MKNLYCLLLFLLFACNPFSKNDLSEEEKLVTQQMRDAKTATGKHGYFVVMSIIGRLKTTPITQGLPVEINVEKINKELLEKQIAFKVLDSLYYQISYKRDEEDIRLKGRFNSTSGNEQIQLNVSPSFENKLTESVKIIDYSFRVYSY